MRRTRHFEELQSSSSPENEPPRKNARCNAWEEDEILPVHSSPSSAIQFNARLSEHANDDPRYMNDGSDDFVEPVNNLDIPDTACNLSEKHEDESIDINDSQVEAKLNDQGFECAGILESVRLDRFMCHYCFECKLGPNVNIVNGANGSGKSAIVAALQIGLGARASKTERGSNTESFIMHGENSAVITIAIANRKPENDSINADMTFKHDLYGDKIVIQHRLRRRAGGTWSVKDHTMKNVKMSPGTTPRQEVDNIVNHFGIIVDNPVAVLTQSESKKFLARCRSTDHHKFYAAATMLGPLKRELDETEKVWLILKNDLALKEKRLLTGQEKVRELKRVCNEAQAMKTVDTRISELEILFAWTVLEEEQNAIGEMEARINADILPSVQRAMADVEESTASIRKLCESVTRVNTLAKTAAEKLVQIANIIGSYKKEETDAKAKFERCRKEVFRCEGEMQELLEAKQSAEHSLRNAQVDHLNQQERKGEILDRLERAKVVITDLDDRLQSSQRKQKEAHEMQHAIEDRLQKAQEDVQRTSYELERLQREQTRQRNIARRRENVGRFGGCVLEVLESIERNRHWFHHSPVGPIGQYITVKDQSWADAIEVCLGRSTLQTFLTQDVHDAKLLGNMIPRGEHMPHVVVIDLFRERYNIPGDQLPMVHKLGHYTMLDMLKIGHNAVFNLLVDHMCIEQIVLLSNEEDVTSLGWRGLQNVHMVWNKKAERAYIRNRSKVFRNSPERRGTKGLLGPDMRQMLDALDSQVSDLDKQLQEHERILKTCQYEMNASKRILKLSSADLDNITKKRQNAKLKKARAEDELDRSTVEFDSRPFDDDISRLEKSYKEAKMKKDTHRQLMSEIQPKIADNQRRVRDAVAQKLKANDEEKALLEELEMRNNILRKEKWRMRLCKSIHKECAARLEAAYNEIKQKNAEVAEKMVVAYRCGPRPPSIDVRDNPSSAIDKTLIRLNEALETEQNMRDGKSIHTIEMEYLRHLKEFKRKKALMKRLKFYELSLDRGLKRRRRNRLDLERIYQKRVRHYFDMFMRAQGHNGNLEFRTNDDGVPELLVKTRMFSHRRVDGEIFVTKNLRSLSGGERSFTTFAFILALGEACANPVRIMDEVDIFQDNANRSALFKIMVKYCSTFLRNKQFVIITPQKLPDIDVSDNVQIVQLESPRRPLNVGTRRLSTTTLM